MLLLALDIFLLLTAYYVLKTAREPLILVGGNAGFGGAELKSYAAGGQAILLLAIVPAYARLSAVAHRKRLVNITVGVLIACLGVFAASAAAGWPIGLVYYVWLGLASLLGVAQFWSLASDLYSREAGERLFPAIAAGGTLGALAGARLAHWLVGRVDVPWLLVTGGAVLCAYLAVYNVIERHERRSGRAVRAVAPIGTSGAFTLTVRQPYLLLLGFMVACATVVNAQGEYILARSVTAHAEKAVPDQASVSGAPAQGQSSTEIRDARRTFVGRVYASYYSTVNVIALLLQCFVVSRVLKRLGVGRALFVMPAVALIAYGGVALLPMFALVRAAKVTENSTDYSLHNTVRHALFLPTSREAKYNAKAAIDSFFPRFGDVLAAVIVLTGVHLLGLSVRQFALLNVGVIALWLLLATAVSARYRALGTASLPVASAGPTSPS